MGLWGRGRRFRCRARLLDHIIGHPAPSAVAIPVVRCLPPAATTAQPWKPRRNSERCRASQEGDGGRFPAVLAVRLGISL